MSKRKICVQPEVDSRTNHKSIPRFSSKTLIITSLLISLTITGLLLAQWREFRPLVKSPVASRTEPTMVQSQTPQLAKEYIYAGGRLIATEEPTASSNGDHAQFISMEYREPCSNTWLPISAGSFGIPRQSSCSPTWACHTYPVRIIMKNTGSTTWIPGAYYLGSQNPPFNTTWSLPSAPFNRVPLPAMIAPNQLVTFEFNVSRPVGFPPTSFNFQWQMSIDALGIFFGEPTTNVTIPAGSWLCSSTHPNYATLISQSVPSLMFAGQTYSVSVTMNNGGTNTWSAAGNYKLGSQMPQDNTTWGLNRVAVPSSVSPGSNVTFTFNVTAPSTPGNYNFQWMMLQEGVEWFGFATQPLTVVVNKKSALGYLDFNNDRKTDIAVWRPSNQFWYIDTNLNGSPEISSRFFNTNTDRPAPGDYNSDGRADLAVQRTSSNNNWYIDYDFSIATFDSILTFPAGIPVSHDYNGDGSTDIAVFKTATREWVLGSSTVTFGLAGDIPIPADYNLDGKADLAVFRPSNGGWYVDTDRNGTVDIIVGFGQNGDIPLPMDYNGDGKADFALFRPSTNQWFIDTNHDGLADITITFGASGDIPVPGDYNGDGRVDVGVFRPSTRDWFIDFNIDGTADITVNLGQSGDIPIRQNGWILKAMGILPY